MLEVLYKKGYLNYEKIILNNAKILGLSPEESIVLIYILEDYLKTGSVSIENIQNHLLMTSSKIDKTVAALMERGFYEIYLTYDNGIGKECVSFQPLFIKIEGILSKKDTLDKFDIEKANKLLTDVLKRVLTASELEILQQLMMEEHYSYEQIAQTIETLQSAKKVISMRTITQTLANKKANVEPTKKTPSVLKDFYAKL